MQHRYQQCSKGDHVAFSLREALGEGFGLDFCRSDRGDGSGIPDSLGSVSDSHVQCVDCVTLRLLQIRYKSHLGAFTSLTRISAKAWSMPEFSLR